MDLKIRLKKMSWPYRLAWIISLVAIVVATVPPYMDGSGAISPERSLTVLTVLVLAWTAAAATDNLREFRKARVAAFTPIIDVFAPERIHATQDRDLRVTVRNLGEGAAKRLRLRIWRREGSMFDGWFTAVIYDPTGVIGPGGEQEMALPVTHNDLWRDQMGTKISDVDEAEADFVIDVEFDDPMGNHRREIIPFGEVTDEETNETVLRRLDDSRIPDLTWADRKGLLRQDLNEFADQYKGSLLDWEMPDETSHFQLNVHRPEGTIMIHRNACQPLSTVAVLFRRELIKYSEGTSQRNDDRNG